MVNHESVFAALGDPSRCRMVERLATTEASISQLAREASISLPATLKHVRVLEAAGLVSRTKRGRTVTVRLETDALARSEAWLHRTRTFWTARVEALVTSLEPPDAGAAQDDAENDPDDTEDGR